MNEGEHHDHLVCVSCGKVVEFVDDVIEQHQNQIAKANGFKITEHSLIIYGQCKNCQ